MFETKVLTIDDTRNKIPDLEKLNSNVDKMKLNVTDSHKDIILNHNKFNNKT